MRYRGAYTPKCNRVIEHCQQTVKRIAARMWCSIQEAVYWYITPRDDLTTLTTPANRIYSYEQRIKGINQVSDISKNTKELYKIGDLV